MKNNLAVLLLFIASIGILSSCSKKGISEEMTPTIHNTGEVISGSTEAPDLRSLFATESRVALTPKIGDDGSKQGMNITWTEGEQVPLYTYFKQGSKQRPAEKAMITIKKRESDGKFVGIFEIKVPSGIQLNSGEKVYITGAIGIDGIDNDGVATISRSENVLEDGYIPPMYFPFYEVEEYMNGNAKAYIIKPHFKFYGSILNLHVTNNMYDPLTINQIIFDTDELFQVEGRMNLTTATGSTPPSWQPLATDPFGTNEKKWQVINIKPADFDQTTNKTRSFPIWIKPDPNKQKSKKQVGEPDPEFIVYFHNHKYKQSPATRGETGNTYKLKKDIKSNKVYDLPTLITSDLIFTEYSTAGNNCDLALMEVYNPTMDEIRIRAYNLVRRDPNEPGRSWRAPLGQGYGTIDRLSWVIKDVTPYEIQSQTIGRKEGYLLPGQKIIYFSNKIDLLRHFNGNYPKGLAYLISFDGDADPGPIHWTTQVGSAYIFRLSGKSSISLEKAGTVVDALFRFSDEDTRKRKTDAPGNVDFIRKPDRNFPATYFQLGSDEENRNFVGRKIGSNLPLLDDYGYRFGILHSGQNIYGTNSNITLFGLTPDYQLSTNRYTPPMNWVQQIAH